MVNKKTLSLTLIGSLIAANCVYAMEQNNAPRPSSNYCSFEHAFPSELEVQPENPWKIAAYKNAINVASLGVTIATSRTFMPLSHTIADKIFPIQFDSGTWQMQKHNLTLLAFFELSGDIAGAVFSRQATKLLDRHIAKVEYDKRRRAIAMAWAKSNRLSKTEIDSEEESTEAFESL